MVRSLIVVASLMSVLVPLALAENTVSSPNKTTKVRPKVDYLHTQPMAVEAAVFADQRPSQMVGLAAVRNERDLVVAEGAYGDPGVLYTIDLKNRWRSTRYEISHGFGSLATMKNEVISATFDEKVRIHECPSLTPRTTIAIGRGSRRAAGSPDGRMIGVVLEGFEFRDDSPGREVYLCDADSGKLIKQLSTDLFQGLHIQFSPNGRDLAVCGGVYQVPRGGIMVWDTVTGAKKIDITVDAVLRKIAYSDDGKWLVGTGNGGTVVVDTETGKKHQVGPTRGHDVLIMPDGKTAVVSAGNRLVIHSLPDLEIVKTVPCDQGFVTSMAMLDSGRKILTASLTSIHQWDTKDWSHELFIDGRVSISNGTSLTAIPDSNLLAVASGRVLRIVDERTGRVWNSVSVAADIQTIMAHCTGKSLGLVLSDGRVVTVEIATGEVQVVGKASVPPGSKLSADLKSVVFVSTAGQIVRRRLEDDVERAAPVKFDSAVTALKVSELGNIVCGLDSGAVNIIDSELTRVVAALPRAASGSVTCLDWRDQDRQLVIGDETGVSRWSVNPQGAAHLLSRSPISDKPSMLAFSNSGTQIAVGLANGSVTLLPAAKSDAPVPSNLGAGKPLVNGVWLKGDRELVVANVNGLLGRIKLKAKPLSAEREFTAVKGTPIKSACLNDKGDRCFVAVGRKIEVRSTSTWDVIQELGEHRGVISHVRVSPDGKWLASTGQDSFLQIRSNTDDVWDVDRTMFLPAEGHRVKWSPDGRWLLVGMTTPEVHVIDTKTWDVVQKLQVPFIANSIDFSSDGRRAVMAGINLGGSEDECPVQVWDTSTWTVQKTFHGHRQGIQAVAMSDDGTRFYSTAGDSQLLEWSTIDGTPRRIRNLPMSGTNLSMLADPKLAIVSWHFANLGIVELATGELVCATEGHPEGNKALMQDVAVSGDGQWAISCAIDELGQETGRVKLWRIGNVLTGE